ncbi:dUTPase [Clostridium novyi]|uniref:dUTPase n=1 Tax=Clostridium novyi TaxID=1542 RepID=UPI0004D9435D|nr:dUTPase [Clostridium novyi]KEH84569.1 putative DUTPase [Clostridium novyi A str. NCTC 538]KEH84643.1 putative DUTPase [Clostridium novyi A str. 4540]
MDLKKFLKMQKQLDEAIVKRHFGEVDQKKFLSKRLLALNVEVGELANATRCFKYWSTKGPESKERILDEYADVMHFWLSVGHTLGFTAKEIEEAYLKKHKENYRRQEQGY